MGGIMASKPKTRGPSAAQLKLQKEQVELAKQQQAQANADRERLKAQEIEAQKTADAERDQRIKKQRSARLRRLGRSSLIKTGSELGTSGSLG